MEDVVDEISAEIIGWLSVVLTAFAGMIVAGTAIVGLILVVGVIRRRINILGGGEFSGMRGGDGLDQFALDVRAMAAHDAQIAAWDGVPTAEYRQAVLDAEIHGTYDAAGNFQPGTGTYDADGTHRPSVEAWVDNAPGDGMYDASEWDGSLRSSEESWDLPEPDNRGGDPPF